MTSDSKSLAAARQHRHKQRRAQGIAMVQIPTMESDRMEFFWAGYLDWQCVENPDPQSLADAARAALDDWKLKNKIDRRRDAPANFFDDDEDEDFDDCEA